MKKAKELLSYVGRKLYKFRLLIAGILLLVLVLLKLHGSSIGMWDMLIQPETKVSYGEILKSPRAIRGDEWLVNTPYAIAQYENNFQYFNASFRSTTTDVFILSHAPIRDISVLTKPFNIAYLFMDAEYALSFYWFGRIIVLFIVTFEFCMILSKKKKLLSLMGACMITFGAATVWWLSQVDTEIFIFGELICIILSYFLKAKKKFIKLLLSLAMSISIGSYVMALYPAFQVTFGYIYGIVFLYIMFTETKENKLKFFDYLMMVLSLIVAGLLLLRIFIISKDTINLVMNTAYPGSRMELGGSNFELMFNYLWSLSLPFTEGINASALSSYYSLFPIPIIVSIWYLIKNKFKDKLLLFLTILSIIYLLFLLVPFPEIIARFTLLSLITTKRITLPLGFICILIMLILLSKKDWLFKLNLKTKFLSLVIAIIVTLLSFYLVPQIDLHIGLKIFYFFLILVTGYFFLTKRKTIFALAMIIVSLMTYLPVNPLYVGIKVFEEKPIIQEIKKLYSEEPGVFATYDTMYMGNFLAVAGVPVLTTTHFYPAFDLWKKVDPDFKYIDYYNRYAHVVLKLTDDKIKMENPEVDQLYFYANYDALKNLNIKYLVSKDMLEKSYLEQIYIYQGIFIYKVI